MKIEENKQYRVQVNRPVKVGRVWLRPGTEPILKGRVIEELGNAVSVLAEVGA